MAVIQVTPWASGSRSQFENLNANGEPAKLITLQRSWELTLGAGETGRNVIDGTNSLDKAYFAPGLKRLIIGGRADSSHSWDINCRFYWDPTDNGKNTSDTMVTGSSSTKLTSNDECPTDYFMPQIDNNDGASGHTYEIHAKIEVDAHMLSLYGL